MHEYSSKRLGTLASAILRNPNVSEEARSLAGSVLSQMPDNDIPEFEFGEGALIRQQGDSATLVVMAQVVLPDNRLGYVTCDEQEGFYSFFFEDEVAPA